MIRSFVCLFHPSIVRHHPVYPFTAFYGPRLLMNSTIGVNDVPFAQVKPSLLFKHISSACLAAAHAPVNRRSLVTSEIDIPCSIYTDMRILSSRAMQTVSIWWPPLHTTPHGFLRPLRVTHKGLPFMKRPYLAGILTNMLLTRQYSIDFPSLRTKTSRGQLGRVLV